MVGFLRDEGLPDPNVSSAMNAGNDQNV